MPDTIVFAGDSITDSGHREPDRAPLGSGYVSLIAPQWQQRGWTVVNAGIAGDRIRDVAARWHTDVERHTPAVISVLIGINDVWRGYSEGDPTTAVEFESVYRSLLERPAGREARWIVCEPFLMPATPDQRLWAEDLDPKRGIARGLALEYDAAFVPLHELLTTDAAHLGAEALTTDGVHLTALGHQRLAHHWLEHAGL